MSAIFKTKEVDGRELSFIHSSNIKVFPCAYRGYHEADAEGNCQSIDPEAKAQTEYNYVNLHNKLGVNKPSYVISFKNATLYFIIGGYYFEIYGIDSENLNALKNKYLGISLRDIYMLTTDSESRSTKILNSFTDNADYLDATLEGTLCFTGLAISDTSDDFTAYLKPFDGTGKLAWSAKTIYDVLDTGDGEYSLRSLCGDHQNNASGKYAIALGEGTKASAEGQVVLGKYNDDSETSNDILVVGNGQYTTTAIRSNSFRLSKAGDINTAGGLSTIGAIQTESNLTVKGTATIKGATSIVGAADINGDVNAKKSLVVSKTASIGQKVTIASGGADITGNVAIKSGSLTVGDGGANITGNSRIDGTTTSTGKLTVSDGGAEITGNTTIAGALTTANDVTINSGVIKLAGNDKGIVTYSTSTNQFELNKPLKVNGTITATGKMYAVDFQATGSSTMQGIDASGDIKTTANMEASKVSAGTMKTTGLMEAGSITADGAMTAGSISTKGAMTAGSITTGGAMTAGSITTKGAVATGALTTTGAASISGSASVGSLQSNGSATIEGDTIVKQSFTVTGNSTVAAITTGNLTVTGTTNSIAGTLTLSGTGKSLDASAGAGQIGAVTISNAGAISGATTISASNNIASSGGSIKAATYMEAPYFNATSDRRLKQNIKDYTCNKSILNLPIKEYEYISAPGKVHIGCLAQDLQEICPELVNINDNGYLVIEESKLVYLLIQEVKNLKDKIERLENR